MAPTGEWVEISVARYALDRGHLQTTQGEFLSSQLRTLAPIKYYGISTRIAYCGKHFDILNRLVKLLLRRDHWPTDHGISKPNLTSKIAIKRLCTERIVLSPLIWTLYIQWTNNSGNCNAVMLVNDPVSLTGQCWDVFSHCRQFTTDFTVIFVTR